ncbi:MAG TPA: hypothetical protein VGU70_13205 [Methylobacterium sp.]|jgi:hypothetical protein|uniref:hypothetical protein n=1 Tax=Methylorubrum sp. B1-46 TaxID=2897334 RepID=UPI001E6141F9|nr:hypothetical protein [Methylorubrum sp. B1-46]UGB27698.1 hypothetical protein LPC10_09085 [Methylorubrum sp. B1-46]HEV2543709.1 hypothetical protein [Methylobacterium sp.]
MAASAPPTPAQPEEVPGSVRNLTVMLFDAVAADDFAKVDPSLAGMRRQVNVNNGLDRRYLNAKRVAAVAAGPAGSPQA